MSFSCINPEALEQEIYFLFDIDNGLVLVVAPYDIHCEDIEKRIRGYIELLDVFYENSGSERLYWFNMYQFYKTRAKLNSIISTKVKNHLIQHETSFLNKMHKRLLSIQKNKR